MMSGLSEGERIFLDDEIAPSGWMTVALPGLLWGWTPESRNWCHDKAKPLNGDVSLERLSSMLARPTSMEMGILFIGRVFTRQVTFTNFGQESGQSDVVAREIRPASPARGCLLPSLVSMFHHR